jgi:MFS family permease
VALTRTGNPEITRRTRLSLPRLFAISPLGVAGCMTAGLVNSSFYGMGAVYGQAVGLKPGAVSLFMTVTLVGGLLAQFPVGAFSDRMDRRRLMLILTLAAAAIAGVMAISGVSALLPLAALGFLMDTAAHPLYGLSVAQTNDYVERDQFVPAAGGLLLAYGIGASLGPIVSSQVMEAMGPRGLFAFIMAACCCGLHGLPHDPPHGEATGRTGRFIKVPQTTQGAAELDPRAGTGAPRENAENEE